MQLGHRHQLLRVKKARPADKFRGVVSFAVMDTLAYAASFLSLFFTLDQVRIIWIEHNVSGVSFVAWAAYTLSSIVWLAYGYMHRDRVLIVTNFLWIIFNGLVVVGVLLYAGQ
jgi:uncharacterized protein with PQ loop repeat